MTEKSPPSFKLAPSNLGYILVRVLDVIVVRKLGYSKQLDIISYFHLSPTQRQWQSPNDQGVSPKHLLRDKPELKAPCSNRAFSWVSADRVPALEGMNLPGLKNFLMHNGGPAATRHLI